MPAENEALQEAFRLAGRLLAHQVDAGAKGELPMPLAAISSDQLESPKFLLFNTQPSTYERLVASGQITLSQQRDQLRAWALSYDADLKEAGRVILLEVGWTGADATVELSQRYVLSAGGQLALIGETGIVGQELLPSALLAALEDGRWHDSLIDGTMSSGLEDRWAAWSSKRHDERFPMGIDELHFRPPHGWIARPDLEGSGVVFFRLIPVGTKDEPGIAICPVVMQPAEPADVIASQKAALLAGGAEDVEAEIIAVPSLSSRAARLRWQERVDGRVDKKAKIFLPRETPGHYFFLVAASRPEMWEETARALAELLASFDRPTKGFKGLLKKWLGKLR
jgi:hypothetical protein